MVLALSTAHQVGLATMGALFIVFALVSSFVLPRQDANFPGQWRNWYLVVCVIFFVAMMGAVLVFGRESKEAEAKAPETTTEAAQPSGDAAAGKAVFAKYSCGSCHTFKPAGTAGKVGPDLDDLKEAADKAGQPLDQFIRTSVTDPNAYVAPGFKPGTMPKFPLTPKEVDDVVAFLGSGA